MLSELPTSSARQPQKEKERERGRRKKKSKGRDEEANREGEIRGGGKKEVSGTKSKGDSQKRVRVNKRSWRGEKKVTERIG